MKNIYKLEIYKNFNPSHAVFSGGKLDKIHNFFINNNFSKKPDPRFIPVGIAPENMSDQELDKIDYLYAFTGIPLFSKKFAEMFQKEKLSGLEFSPCKLISSSKKEHEFCIGVILNFLNIQNSKLTEIGQNRNALLFPTIFNKIDQDFIIARDIKSRSLYVVSESFKNFCKLNTLNIGFEPVYYSLEDYDEEIKPKPSLLQKSGLNLCNLYTVDSLPNDDCELPSIINCISSWSNFVPFTFRVLVSGNSALCASLISEGFEPIANSEAPCDTYAICGNFEIGYQRLNKFHKVVQKICEGSNLNIAEQLQQFLNYLLNYQEKFFLLDTAEVDFAFPNFNFKSSVLAQLEKCKAVGLAIEMLSTNVDEATVQLKLASSIKQQGIFEVFYGLQLNEYYDSSADEKTSYPLELLI